MTQPGRLLWPAVTGLMFILATLAACKPERTPKPQTTLSGTEASAPAGIRLIAPLPESDWPLPNGDLANTRYSPLAQITPANVANLRVKTTLSTGIPHGHEGGPLVVGSTMYIVTPFPNNVIAVDLTQPGER